jgi:hypothetical protein
MSNPRHTSVLSQGSAHPRPRDVSSRWRAIVDRHAQSFTTRGATHVERDNRPRRSADGSSRCASQFSGEQHHINKLTK